MLDAIEPTLKLGLSGVKTYGAQRPIVAIIGRPNVGKSTMFNRLIGGRIAITDDEPGVTRDRIYGQVEWDGRRFSLVDTGGYLAFAKDGIDAAIRQQAETAIAEADVVILMVDGQNGITDLDREVATSVHRAKCPCLLAVNKMDQPNLMNGQEEFYALGFGEPFQVSAATGKRTGDLLSEVLILLGEIIEIKADQQENTVKVALAGRPNVGKSTMVNCLAGHHVSIVDHRPGTTRDTTNIKMHWKTGHFIELMDTAGLRRRRRVDNQVEFYSSLRASTSIAQADVVILVLDALEGVAVQDARIADQIIQAGRGMVIAVNKWDQQEEIGKKVEEYRNDLYDRFPFWRDYPLVFTAGLTGKRVLKCLDTAIEVQENRRQRIGTARLNKFIEDIQRQNPVPQSGKEIRVYYATQLGNSPPFLAFYVNHPRLIPQSYKRFLEKKLRQEFAFEGTPVLLSFRKSS